VGEQFLEREEEVEESKYYIRDSSYPQIGDIMSLENSLEKVAEEAEDLVELAEDLGIISEADEKKYKALIRKALPALVIVVPILLVILQ